MKFIILSIFLLAVSFGAAQETGSTYKKKVLEQTEVDFLGSFYSQDGDNAAVTGGIGTEELTDFAPTIVVSVPMNADDVLSVEAGISAYSSASSSNINPFDGDGPADPFQASSGASSSDVWVGATASYSHSSDDRNRIWSAKASFASEYDYFSFGFGGSYTMLFNEKNTEVSINANVFLDTWDLLYPVEFRDDFEIDAYQITGNPDYNPVFTGFDSGQRNSYSAGLTVSQILSKKLQGLISLDVVRQDGLLSTPFQRVYFADFDETYIDNFALADDVEQLPDTRNKIAVGANLNYYINEYLTLRTYYRYYTDDWGIDSHTAKIELPIKLYGKFTVYPSYRFYTQTQADYFAPYNEHFSTNTYYTSDYDLSAFDANQYGIGFRYTDIFTKSHLWKFGLKSIDLEYSKYDRDTSFSANLIAFSFKFVMD
jgi:hypothetical protein